MTGLRLNSWLVQQGAARQAAMSARLTSFAVGLMLVGLGGFAAVSQDHPRHRYENDIRGTSAWIELKHRAAARAGIPRNSEHLFELDHIVPCCLFHRCDNRLSNLQMQPWDDARSKDELERHACAEHDAGRLDDDAALAQFSREFP